MRLFEIVLKKKLYMNWIGAPQISKEGKKGNLSVMTIFPEQCVTVNSVVNTSLVSIFARWLPPEVLH